jgi:hypothetical protein
MSARRLDTSQIASFSEGSFLSTAIDLGQSGTLEGLLSSDFGSGSNIKFKVSLDNVNYYDSKDANGVEWFVKDMNGNDHRALNGSITKGVKFIKLERELTVGEYNITAIISYDE